MIQIDMPMPKNCADCCFATADLVNGTITLFCMTLTGRKMYAPDLISRTTRPEWCPLKEQEAKRGKWIPVANSRGGMECSICHDYAPNYSNGLERLSLYCPNCGAKMKAVKCDA